MAPAGALPRDLGRYGLIVAQLLALLVLTRHFALESESFLRLFALAAGGFALHYFLPFRLRLPCFVLLSMLGLALVMGPIAALWAVGLGLGVIGLCHLPVPIWLRGLILLGVGCAAAYARKGFVPVPWSAALWPILGSLFVFRVIYYLHDLKHQPGPRRFSETLGYFFLLPNVCFPLFPVVDIKDFRRNYYDSDRHGIYQVGLQWIWRGLLQLVLYRFVYYHVTIDSLAVANFGDLVRYMVSTFLLYVRISGQFHVIIGLLHLFGWNLPETHHRYFLAASFTDFWRRINIYWKDFMMRIFYYPLYFRVRKLGETKALVIATLFTFVITWFLHLVQWYWIRGSLLIEANDILFWSIFALLVLGNSLWEAKAGRVRTLSKRARTVGESVSLVLRTALTFCVICTLWSLWTAESFTDWRLLMAYALKPPPLAVWAWVALVGGIAALGIGLVIAVRRGLGSGRETFSPTRSAAWILATSLLLPALSSPLVTDRLGATGLAIESLRSTHLSRRDAERLQRGYYESLLAVNEFNPELNRIYQKLPNDFVRNLAAIGMTRSTNDYRHFDLAPLKEGRFIGGLMSTNRWGMRDRDYEQARPAGGERIAIVSASHAMGSGVLDDETFEGLVETRQNRERKDGVAACEILNFAVAGYSPLQSLVQLENKAFDFDPTVALFFAHGNDPERTMRHFCQMTERGVLSPHPYLRELVQRARIGEDMGANEAMRRVRPYTRELLGWVYAQMVIDCRAHGVVPVFCYLEGVNERDEAWRQSDRALVMELARAAGFTIIELGQVYGDYQPAELWVMENDGHPNALGNRLIADRLYPLLFDENGRVRFETKVSAAPSGQEGTERAGVGVAAAQDQPHAPTSHVDAPAEHSR